MNRRQALSALGVATVGTGLLGWLGGRGGGMALASGASASAGLVPEVTPSDRFYTVSKNFLFSPSVRVADWRLDVHGLVARTLALSYDDLAAMPAVEQYATLACISNEVPATAIGNASWRGVRLCDVLDRAGGVSDAAVDLVFVCADNYTDSIPIAKALDPATLLVYAMNDEPLPRAHGYPLRAIVPGIYGMKNAKWIEALDWRPARTGEYHLTVRATDGAGVPQTRDRSEPAPDGATGWHTIDVRVD
jgi:DMSO/TMAO reductase YedYZ molybdopterin-dependent catalytic subunit